tara:strand:+ start:1145 stop:1513 length:369 start_codon:yes stop_codon:yes gene_type:complete
MSELGNMTGPEMAGSVAFCAMVLKVGSDFTLKLIDKVRPKVSPINLPDADEITYRVNMTGVLDETRKLLEKMNDKGDDRAKTLDTMNDRGIRDHERIKAANDNLAVLTNLIATGDFCHVKKN